MLKTTLAKLIAILALAFAAATPAMAYTECSIAPTHFLAVGDNSITVFVGAATPFIVGGSLTASKLYTAIVMSSIVTGRPLTVRFTANSLACGSIANRTDIDGVYMVQ